MADRSSKQGLTVLTDDSPAIALASDDLGLLAADTLIDAVGTRPRRPHRPFQRLT